MLDDISFTAEKGDVVALLGSSGSGKSTLLRCINLLEQGDKGIIQLNGFTIDHEKLTKKYPSKKMLNDLRAKAGMVFQHFNLWPHMTVLQNLITAPIHVLKQSKDEAIAQAETLLKKVGMDHKQQSYPSQLSGGQQQRVAIARALMMQPEVMLFDEPTSALDPEMVSEVLNVMRLLAQEGMTMVIASHEIAFARDVATHAIFLEHGKIHEEGEAKEMLKNPQTERLQQFLKSVT